MGVLFWGNEKICLAFHQHLNNDQDMLEYTDHIGFIAGIIFGLSGIAQAVKIYKLKGGDSVSLLNYTMMITGMILWTIYATLHEAWMFVFWNSFAISIQMIVIALTLYYARKRYYLQPKYERRQPRP